MTPLVSVIIPVWNGAAFVAEAVNSALEQTHQNIEIIVTDDGSTDDTWAVLAQFRSNPKVKLLRQQNLGCAAARNIALAQSTGEFVAFLDADDLWAPDKIEKQLPKFDNPAVGLVYTRRFSYISDGTGNWIPNVRRNAGYDRTSYPTGKLFENILIDELFISAPSVIVRRAIFDKLGFFDTDLATAEDRLMWAKISHDWELELIDEPLTFCRVRSESLSRNVEIEPQTLSFLKKVFTLYPETRRNPRIMDAYSRWAILTGRDMLNRRNFQGARANFWEACKTKPQHLTHWVWFTASFVPRPLLNFVSRIRHTNRSK